MRAILSASRGSLEGMTVMSTVTDDHSVARLDQPLYGYAEAARLARLPVATVRRWLLGYRYSDDDGIAVVMPPVTRGERVAEREGVSFLDLVELAAIGRLKERGFSLVAIRRVVAYCREELDVAHPLATARFRTDGRDIFIAHEGALLDVLRRRGAYAWDDVLAPFLDTLDYEDDLARRWWPMGRQSLIVVDPEIGFGLPVVAGVGVRTETIGEHFRAGDPTDAIAREYGLDREQVERALRFELRLAA